MASVDTCLHLIGAEVLIILGIVIPLLDDKTHKRAVHRICGRAGLDPQKSS